MAGRRADAAYWYEIGPAASSRARTTWQRRRPGWPPGTQQPVSGPLRRQDVDAPAARRGRVPAIRRATTRSRASGTTRTPSSPTRIRGQPPDAAVLRRLPPHAVRGRDGPGRRARGDGGARPGHGRRHRPPRRRLLRHRLVGHTYGPDSQEAMDQLLRLDRRCDGSSRRSDRRVGPGRTLVVLSADHGSLPLVEVLQARGVDARRVAPDGAREAGARPRWPPRFPGGDGARRRLRHAQRLPGPRRASARRGLKPAEVEAVIEKALLDDAAW